MAWINSYKAIANGVTADDGMGDSLRDGATSINNNFDAFAEAINAQAVSQNSGMIGYATKADMDANLSLSDGSLALVTNDTTAENNGTYRKNGDAGAGSWVKVNDRVGQLSSDLASSAEGKGASLVFDATRSSELASTETGKGAALVAIEDPLGCFDESDLEGAMAALGRRKRNASVSLGWLQARMAAGETVRIACFGDSTTDGNNTTGWTQNTVDGSGNAVGVDHNAQAPNSWPVVLQGLLRTMYGNTNICVFNAGYSGQRLDNGWALANYPAAVPLNTSYGPCDAVIVDFGLNDIQAAGSQTNNHAAQFRLLVKRIMQDGSLPILLTSGPEFRDSSDGDIRDNEEIASQINTLKLDLAAEFNIPLFDKAGALLRWLNTNNDGYAWATVQSDALHFGDAGHRMQAGFIAAKLFNNAVTVSPGVREAVTAMDPRSGSSAGRTMAYYAANSRYGVNPLYSEAYVQAHLGQALQTAWVWNESPDAAVLYRCIDNDAQSSRASASKLVVHAYATGSDTYNAVPPNVGNAFYSFVRFSDQPLVLCGLKYGLNRVDYVAPTAWATGSGALFAGYFDFVPDWRGGRLGAGQQNVNALCETGPLFLNVAASSGITWQRSREAKNGSNVVCLGAAGKPCSLLLEAQIDGGGGIMLAASRGFGTANWDASGLLLFRNSAGDLALYTAGIRSDGTVDIGGTALATAEWTAKTGYNKVRVDFVRETNGDRTVKIYDGWTATTLLATLTSAAGTETRVPSAGYFGDLFFNTGSNAGGGTVHVTQALIKYAL